MGFSSGVLISYILGGYLNWKTVCYIYGIIFGIHAVALLMVPESPTWLFSVEKREAAKKSLEFMGRKHEVEEQDREAKQVIKI